MAGLKIQTAQTDFAVTLAEIKSHLKIETSDDDTLLGIIRVAVDSWAKEYTHRTLCTTIYELFIDDLSDINVPLREGMYNGIDAIYNRRPIVLPFSPVSAINHAKYYGDNDVAVTYSTDNYFLDTASIPSRFTLKTGKTFPNNLRPVNGFEIKYTAGYGANTSVPSAIKMACLIYASYLYEHRGDNETPIKAPYSATALLEPYVVKRLSTNPYMTNRNYSFGVYG